MASESEDVSGSRESVERAHRPAAAIRRRRLIRASCPTRRPRYHSNVSSVFLQRGLLTTVPSASIFLVVCLCTSPSASTGHYFTTVVPRPAFPCSRHQRGLSLEASQVGRALLLDPQGGSKGMVQRACLFFVSESCVPWVKIDHGAVASGDPCEATSSSPLEPLRRRAGEAGSRDDGALYPALDVSRGGPVIHRARLKLNLSFPSRPFVPCGRLPHRDPSCRHIERTKTR